MTNIKGDGGSTPSQYALPEGCSELQDLVEFKGMNFAIGNIFKAAYRMGSCNHADKEYDLKKIIWFAERELALCRGENYKELKVQTVLEVDLSGKRKPRTITLNYDPHQKYGVGVVDCTAKVPTRTPLINMIPERKPYKSDFDFSLLDR